MARKTVESIIQLLQEARPVRSECEALAADIPKGEGLSEPK
jgi:hypothetical protein